MPAEGVLKYIVLRSEAVSTRKKEVQIIMTDGFIVRTFAAEVAIDHDETFTDAQLNQAWDHARARTVNKRLWRRAEHMVAQVDYDNVADAMYVKIQGVADPSLADILTVISSRLNPQKQIEYDKIYTMLRDGSEDDRHKFMAMVALIVLSRG